MARNASRIVGLMIRVPFGNASSPNSFSARESRIMGRYVSAEGQGASILFSEIRMSRGWILNSLSSSMTAV